MIDEQNQLLINKRSSTRKIFPGYLDLGFGGGVKAEEMDKVDVSARRELYEELGLGNLPSVLIPSSYR